MSGGDRAAQRVVLLGGSSEIGLAIVRACARPGARIALLGRDTGRLAAAAAALTDGGAGEVFSAALEANDSGSHEAALRGAFDRLGGVDLAVLAVGELGERGGLPSDIDAAVSVLRTNVVGAGSLLIHTASLLRTQRAGTLVVLSSVAGEVVRPANVVYGAAKAGLDALALGLHDALRGTGVRVLVVRPGFVRSRMTSGLAVPPLAMAPAAVGRAVAQALERRASIVWAPPRLRWIMAGLRLLPRSLIARLPL